MIFYSSLTNNLTNLIIPKEKTLPLTGFSNSDTSRYYVSRTGIKALLGATTIYSATLGDWHSFGSDIISISYADSTDLLCILFPKGVTFSGGYLDIIFTYI